MYYCKRELINDPAKANISVTKILYRRVSASDALRQAKPDLMNKDGNKMAHPYYRAGLAIIGDDAPAFQRHHRVWWATGGILLAAIAGWIWFRSGSRNMKKAGRC